jgi:hypothetical protein
LASVPHLITARLRVCGEMERSSFKDFLREQERQVQRGPPLPEPEPEPEPGSRGPFSPRHGPSIALSEGGHVATHGGGSAAEAAIADAPPMESGVHFVEITWLGGSVLSCGVVGDAFDAALGKQAGLHADGFM